MDGFARELARGRGGPAAGVRAQSLLARGRAARGGHPLRRARPAAASARVARARHRHVRALSRRPRARGARDHLRPRGARRDRALDRGGPARWSARRPGVRACARRRLRGGRPAPPRTGSAFAWLLDRGGMAVGHFGWDEAAAGLRGARPAPVHGVLRAADFRRDAEQRRLRAVRQPREPRPARVQPGDDRRRGAPRDAPAAGKPADAAHGRARAARLGRPAPRALVHRARGAAACHGGARHHGLLRGRRLLLRAGGAVAVPRSRRADALRPDRAVGAGAALAPRPAPRRGARAAGRRRRRQGAAAAARRRRARRADAVAPAAPDHAAAACRHVVAVAGLGAGAVGGRRLHAVDLPGHRRREDGQLTR